MPKRTNILKRSKRVEAEVAYYFWPDHDTDETGSVRDWKELWDCSGLGWDGELIVCEVKSWKWPRGPRGVWRQLENAYKQVEAAFDERAEDSYLRQSLSFPTQAILLVVYKPTGSQIADALCYFAWHGQMVAMPAHEFKRVFIEGDYDSTH